MCSSDLLRKPSASWWRSSIPSGSTSLEVDLVDLRQAALPLQAQVATFGQPLYRAGPEAERFLDLALKAYARLNEERAALLRDVRTRGRIYG